jgi:hypothetical protein
VGKTTPTPSVATPVFPGDDLLNRGLYLYLPVSGYRLLEMEKKPVSDLFSGIKVWEK